MKGGRSGRGAGPYQGWRIEPQDFYNFIRDYYYLYEPKMVKGKFLRSIIKATPGGQAVPICQAVKVLGISEAEIQRQITSGELHAYKNLAGRVSIKGSKGFRWFVLLDELAFEGGRSRQWAKIRKEMKMEEKKCNECRDFAKWAKKNKVWYLRCSLAHDSAANLGVFCPKELSLEEIKKSCRHYDIKNVCCTVHVAQGQGTHPCWVKGLTGSRGLERDSDFSVKQEAQIET